MGGWQSAVPQHGNLTEPLTPFDATKPNIARAYDYLLGGKDSFAADRELAERLVAIYPGIRQMVAETAGSWPGPWTTCSPRASASMWTWGPACPRPPAVHEIVRRRDSTAAVVYADNDPVVINHLWALAAGGDDHVAAVAGDLGKPAATLDAVQATGLIGLTEPACLILAMVLHFMDAATARDLVAAYVDELAPGSHVIIAVGCGDPAIGAQITRTYDAAPVHNHTPDDVASFFAGLDLISPGIADARAWQPGWSTPAPVSRDCGPPGTGPS